MRLLTILQNIFHSKIQRTLLQEEGYKDVLKSIGSRPEVDWKWITRLKGKLVNAGSGQCVKNHFVTMNGDPIRMGECKGQGSTDQVHPGHLYWLVLRSLIKKLIFLHFHGMKIFLLGTVHRAILAVTVLMLKWIQHILA